MKESPTDQRPISHHIRSDANCHWSSIEPICFSASVRKSLKQRSAQRLCNACTSGKPFHLQIGPPKGPEGASAVQARKSLLRRQFLREIDGTRVL